MRKILLSLFLLAPIVSFANTFPPANIQKLIEKHDVLNDKCRGGSGDNPATIKSCDQRDRLYTQIQKKGWCWGSYNSDASGAELTWLKCKDDATK